MKLMGCFYNMGFILAKPKLGPDLLHGKALRRDWSFYFASDFVLENVVCVYDVVAT